MPTVEWPGAGPSQCSYLPSSPPPVGHPALRSIHPGSLGSRQCLDLASARTHCRRADISFVPHLNPIVRDHLSPCWATNSTPSLRFNELRATSCVVIVSNFSTVLVQPGTLETPQTPTRGTRANPSSSVFSPHCNPASHASKHLRPLVGKSAMQTRPCAS